MEYVLIVLALLAVVPVVYWVISYRSTAAETAGPRRTDTDSRAADAAEPGAGGTSDDPDEEDTPRTYEDESARRAGKLALLGDLAAGIAHEINNPVAIMVEEAGWIEDLLEEEEFRDSANLEECRRAVKQIKTQGTRCKEIIQNLLSFGRKAGIRIEEVQLNDLIRDVVKAYEKRVRAGHIQIESRLAGNLPMVRLSASEMQQILSNLFNNAIDALDARGGRIEIATRLEDPDIVIEVADNGQGISGDLLEKIFDPFFTTKPVGKGTGLGLSICYGLVEKISGDISVESRVGEGTTFHIRIPIGGAEPRRPAAPGAATEVRGEEQADAGAPPVPAIPTAVLVVDDEVPFVEALQRRLSRRNFDVHTANSGEEAMQKLRRRRDIDVVILDIRMAGMDGVQTLREIKAARPLVEVILLSAHTTVESAIEGIKLGAFDYLLKPCDLTQLVDQVTKAKRRKNRQEQRIMEARIKDITARRI
ncbi:MAG: response regulator [Acidobacteriota bacterium]